MAVLAIDTTTVTAAVAVVEKGRVLAEVMLGVQRNHAERILPAVDNVLRESDRVLGDIDKIAVCSGPGSFTGQRIGMSLAKGMAEGLDVPLVPVSTLRVLAEPLSVADGVIVPLLDAQRSQYYCGVFLAAGGVLTQAVPDQACDTAGLPHILREYRTQEILLTGEAAPAAAAAWGYRLAPPYYWSPRASVLGVLAESLPGCEPRFVVPNYVRASSAKPRKVCE